MISLRPPGGRQLGKQLHGTEAAYFHNHSVQPLHPTLDLLTLQALLVDGRLEVGKEREKDGKAG